MAYEARPNSGVLFTNDKKGNDKAPDVKGDIVLSPELVKELANLVNNNKPAKFRIAGWSKTSSGGNKFLSLKADAEQPNRPRFTPRGRGDDAPF